MEYKFETAYDGNLQFIANGWAFKVDRAVMNNKFPNYILVVVDIDPNWTKADISTCVDYLFAYNTETQEIVWDYDVVYIPTTWVEGESTDRVLARSGEAAGSVLVQKEPGYYTYPEGGDEDPDVRESIEIYFYDNLEYVTEGLNMLIAETLLY